MNQLFLSTILAGCLATNGALAKASESTTASAPAEPTPPSVPATTAASSEGPNVPANDASPTSVTPSPAPTSSPAPAATSASSVEPSPYGPATAEGPTAHAEAQEPAKEEKPPTLLDFSSDYAFGGMGGIGVMYTRIGGKNSALVCGEGAVIIDHALTLGGGGCGVTRLLRAQDYASSYDADDRLTFGYGGAIIRYHFRTRKLVNVSVGAMVGAGGVVTGSYTPKNNSDFDKNFKSERHDAVFIVEPQVGAHVNITRWLRVGAVAGYRLVSGVDTQGLSESDIAGPTVGGQIQAGWF